MVGRYALSSRRSARYIDRGRRHYSANSACALAGSRGIAACVFARCEQTASQYIEGLAPLAAFIAFYCESVVCSGPPYY